MNRGALIAILAVALALRLLGIASFPPSDGEAAGVGLPFFIPFGAPLWLGRLCAAAISIVAIAILVRAARRMDDPNVAILAAGLLAIDPLSILATHESPRAAVLAAIGALFVTCSVAMRARDTRAALVAGVVATTMLGFVVLFCCGGDVSSRVADGAPLAWSSGPLLGSSLAALHHLGYAVVPLALAAAIRRPLLVATLLLLCVVLLNSRVFGTRLVDLSLLSAPVAFLAAETIAALRRREREASMPRLAVAGSLLLILAVNAPVLVSDLATGLRFPWRQARAWLQSQRDADRATVTIYSTTPDTARAALGADWRVEPFPATPDALVDLLDSEGERVFVVPVNGGEPHGHEGDWALPLLESRRLSSFDALARRFDLYRFEIRIFRSSVAAPSRR